LPPVLWIDRASSQPLHRQLYERYREAILEGRLRTGERLPSTRGLARELGVSRMPVLQAFEQLLAEGYFEARVGAGTFVAVSLPDLAPRAPERGDGANPRATRRTLARRIAAMPPWERAPWLRGVGPFRVSQPAVESFPLALWASLLARHSRNPPASQLLYADPLGFRPFREALAAYLRSARAVRCEPEQILVVSGSQQALDLAARVLLDPGDSVWMEEPGYGGARDAFALAGARLVPVPVDGEGLDVAAGRLLEGQARAAYVTPSHQYPLGATLSATRRLQLLDWAQRSGSWIIEDDYDSEYRYESPPVAALQGLDRDGRVIYIGTLSKVLFPALRVGYMVLPPDLVPRFAAVREAMDVFPATLYQAALADFLGEGHFARHLRRMRLLYRERRDALVEALRGELSAELEVLDGQAGLHLVATFRPGASGTEGLAERSDRELAERAAREKLWLMPLSTCYLGSPGGGDGMREPSGVAEGFILGYGATAREEMDEAVRRLKSVLRAR
jgi:GntR family transcriptional regulator/MocR family aminotransferase